jgi:hypothetical protein
MNTSYKLDYHDCQLILESIDARTNQIIGIISTIEQREYPPQNMLAYYRNRLVELETLKQNLK